MGQYNPHAPYILGEEWVPIREENIQFAQGDSTVEYGHEFTLATSRTLQDGRIYIRPPSATTIDRVHSLAIYPQGLEDKSGPIKSLLIPCNGGAITGHTPGNPITLIGGASTVAQALYDPSDGMGIQALYNIQSLTQEFSMFFGVGNYTNILSGKRILGVRLRYNAFLYNAQTDGPFVNNQGSSVVTECFIKNDASTIVYDYGQLDDAVTSLGSFQTRYQTPLGTVNFGEVGPLWTTADANTEFLPWRYQDLLRLDVTAANRMMVYCIVQLLSNLGDTFQIMYAALEVIYCEEQRLAWGGIRFRGLNEIIGAIPITMRSNAHVLNPVLSPGKYTVTVTAPTPGSIGAGAGLATQSPFLNSLREFYSTPFHEGIQVNISHAPGLTLTKESTHILPQISLHTSGGPLTEVHVYGRQAIAQVYGTNTAEQEIFDDNVAVNTSYNQVRFYARRFGYTQKNLDFAGFGAMAGITASISPVDFDALPEITDGWKEITLRLNTPAVMGTRVSPDPSFRWSAAGELAGNRWEILGACAPALSGIPGNLFNLVPANQQLYNATYGGTADLSWMPQGVGSAWVATPSTDNSSDAVLIFSQDPVPITGFGVSMMTQAVSGIGLGCGAVPCCIPSAIRYNRLTWSAPVTTLVVLDTFTRSVTGFGTNDTGQTYTDTGGTVPGNYVVNGSRGTHILDGAAGTSRISVLTGSYRDSHQRVQTFINVAPSGASIRTTLIGHYVDASNFDLAEIRWTNTGTVELHIGTTVAGVQTDSVTYVAGAFAAGEEWYLDVDFNGSTIRAKAWRFGDTEPTDYQGEATAGFSFGGVGIRSIRTTGNTDTGAIASYDNYVVSPSTWTFGIYEIQRQDTVDPTWQTIMLATNPGVLAFNDYEARVGIQSSYRIRQSNDLNFFGDWSPTVSITLTSPGVTGGTCLTNGHMLIFTSNAKQNGSINLAYSSAWEGSGSQVVEDFVFPEAGDTILQQMYGRDFVTAFRPLERGGERFRRTLLVQAAAIAPETLGDFKSLRDMAWATVPYICVRDEDGNRWFASVAVPSGKVLRDRRLYLAPIDVTEVTDTPAPVNP